MRIGELASELGIAPETLRSYERLGILPAPARTGACYRDYGAVDIERLRLLAGLRQLDLPLADAAKLATMCAEGRCEEVTDKLRAAIPAERARLRRRVRELRQLDQRLGVLERQLEASHRPRDLIQLESRKEGA
jgi:DNA-binding transcriptional MerR regulator